MQQPDPDHLWPDVAVVIQFVDQVLPRLEHVAGCSAWSDRLWRRLGLLLAGQFLPDALVELLHPILAVGTAYGPPFCHQLQVKYCDSVDDTPTQA